MLREYIISEPIAAHGVRTTRSLAVVTTGEPVYRESVRRGWSRPVSVPATSVSGGSST
jgi:uncharacterized protein YdiU (UPF0061 family)